MFVMSLIKQEQLHLVSCFLMSLILLLSRGDQAMEMQEVLEIELLISCSHKWMV
jgi:hypothetical protein